jgi:hypothetical protein
VVTYRLVPPSDDAPPTRTSSAIAVVDDLGHALEREWRRASYDARVFPSLAVQALTAADLPGRIAPADIVRWILATPVLPPQNDPGNKFGDLAITLFRGPRFIIDAYYWLDGTTSIHQHAFAGAFQVLAGGSVLSRYDFHERRVVNEHFAIGTLTLEEVELLGRGDVRPILPGRQYVHSLFHLVRPSTTIVIRTGTPSAATQYDYHRPFLAVDSSYRNPELLKKVSGVGLLLATKDPDADALIGDLVCAVDFHTAYAVLAEVYRRLRPGGRLHALFDRARGRERFLALIERARAAHGELVDVVLPVLEEQDRQRAITERRGAVTGEAHRFLLALLLSVPGKEHVLRLVHQRVPDRDPVDVVVEWADQLAHVKVFGSDEQNILGVDQWRPDHVKALRHALRDHPAADAECLRQLDASLIGPLTRGPSVVGRPAD